MPHSSVEQFADLPLHDAALGNVLLDWAAQTLRLDLLVFLTRTGGATPCTLTFAGVTSFSASRNNPWGPSVFINGGVFQPPDLYRIEAQSGDIIEIRAADFRLTPSIDLTP